MYSTPKSFESWPKRDPRKAISTINNEFDSAARALTRHISQIFDPGKCESLHMGLARIELVTLVHIRTVEASMQGLFDKPGETINRIYQRWGIGVFALPVLLVIALVGLAMTPRAAPNWISQAAEAEFAGANYRLEAAPAQPAKPVIEIRAAKAN